MLTILTNAKAHPLRIFEGENFATSIFNSKEDGSTTPVSTTNSVSSETAVSQGNKIINNVKVVDYLKRFSYIKQGAMTHESGAVEALKGFQEMANVNVTGELDADTMTMLDRPRCGDPDLQDPTLINDLMGAHEDLDCDDEIYGGDCNRTRRFAVYGTKWRTMKLSYCIVNYPAGTTKKGKKLFAREVAEAIHKWTVFIPLKIKKRRCGKNARIPQIRVKFVQGWHGDRFEFDGAGGVLAHAFFPSRKRRKIHPLTGDVHMDGEEQWVNKGRGDGTCFPYVFTHELGHSLGLTHSKNRNSIMWPFYIPCYKDIKLQLDDIKGIQKIYGKPKIQTVKDMASLHDSPSQFKSTLEARNYCAKLSSAAYHLCSKKDLQRVAKSDSNLDRTEWFWIRDGTPTMAKIDAAACEEKEQSIADFTCYYKKLFVTTDLQPEAKALCCHLNERYSDQAAPEMKLCDGVFDTMVRFQAEEMFKDGEDGLPATRLFSMVFKGKLVYAFDVFGAAMGFPAKISTKFPRFTEGTVCAAVKVRLSPVSVRFILFGKKSFYVYNIRKTFIFLGKMPITKLRLKGLGSCPQIVFIHDKAINFIQGTKLWKYTDGYESVDPIDLAEIKAQGIESEASGLAASEFKWSSISSASSWKSNQIFFFNDKGSYHYYDGVADQFVDGYPRKTAKAWFHFCP